MLSPDLNDLMTEREVAKELRMSVAGVRLLRLRGLLAHFRAGRRVLYSRQHVEEFLRRNEHQATEVPEAA